jgi:hypothetical protein
LWAEKANASIPATVNGQPGPRFLPPIASRPSVDGINTGKRRTDGSRSDTRVGSATTERWVSERFRQVMLLILEFRRNWPTQSLLRMDDVEAIRTAVDNALYHATSNGHVADSENATHALEYRMARTLQRSPPIPTVATLPPLRLPSLAPPHCNPTMLVTSLITSLLLVVS